MCSWIFPIKLNYLGVSFIGIKKSLLNAHLNCIVLQSLDGRSIRVDEAGKGSRRQEGRQYTSRGGGRFGGGSRGRGELESL